MAVIDADSLCHRSRRSLICENRGRNAEWGITRLDAPGVISHAPALVAGKFFPHRGLLTDLFVAPSRYLFGFDSGPPSHSLTRIIRAES